MLQSAVADKGVRVNDFDPLGARTIKRRNPARGGSGVRKVWQGVVQKKTQVMVGPPAKKRAAAVLRSAWRVC